MAAQLTIPQCILVGEITVPLCLVSTSENVLWGQRIIQNPDPVEVALFTDIILWQYEQFSNDPTLRGTANYLIWLCGIFAQRAQGFSGGGSVIPIPPGVRPNPVEFVVDATTSPIIVSGSTLVLPQFIGYNLVFSRNDIIQTQVNNGGTYFQWNKITGLFTCFGAANLDDLFSLNPV